MDAAAFDRLTRRFTGLSSRRTAVLATLAGLVVTAAHPAPVAAGRGQRRCLRKGGTWLPKGGSCRCAFICGAPDGSRFQCGKPCAGATCYESTAGTGVCGFSNCTPCGPSPDFQCGAGQVCVVNTCCPGNPTVCLDPCP